MSQDYLITFTPAGPFFFGGAESFADGFFVQSERFPQPTTIMGALRASLLMKAGLLLHHKRGRGGGRRFIPNALKEKANALTGTAKLNDFDGPPDFGIIQRVSPVFLIRHDESGKPENAYFPTAADVVKDTETGRLKRISHQPHPARISNAGRVGTAVHCADIDWKHADSGPFLGGSGFWAAYLEGRLNPSDLINLTDEDHTKPDHHKGQSPFISREQVGIGLTRRRVQAGQFYVKREYGMKRGWAFGVLARFQRQPDLTRTIYLGGDQSVFHLRAIPADGLSAIIDAHPVLRAIRNRESGLSAAGRASKGVAVSPLLLDGGEPLRDARIAHAMVSQIDNVRMLNSINKDVGRHIRNGRKVLKSDAYRVVPAGSVFFFRDGAADADTPVFQPTRTGLAEAIGYNHWQNHTQ